MIIEPAPLSFCRRLLVALTAGMASTLFSSIAAADAVIPGTFTIPATNTTLSLSGYVQFDATYDFASRDPFVESHDYAAVTARVPLDHGDEGKKRGQLYMTARTTRIGFSTATPTAWADIETRLEGDFWAGSLLSSQTFTNSVIYRLRHAYGTVSGRYGTLLVGQTWSTFSILPASADTVDYNGPGSGAGARQPMVRYEIPLPGAFRLALAAENAPGTDGDGITDGPGQPPIRRVLTVPDLIAQLSTSGPWGTASFAAVTNEYKDAGAPPQDGYSKRGWGLSVGAAVNVFTDTVRVLVSGGRGIGRYMLGAGATGQGATNTGSEFVLWDALGYQIDYTHAWTPRLRSNVIWSQTFFRNNGASTAAAPYEATIDPTTGTLVDPVVNQRLQEIYLNTFWKLNAQVEFGLEYALAQRHTFGNDAAPNPCVAGVLCGSQTGTMHRMTTTVHFNLF